MSLFAIPFPDMSVTITFHNEIIIIHISDEFPENMGEFIKVRKIINSNYNLIIRKCIILHISTIKSKNTFFIKVYFIIIPNLKKIFQNSKEKWIFFVLKWRVNYYLKVFRKALNLFINTFHEYFIKNVK